MKKIDYESFNNPNVGSQNVYAKRWWVAPKEERAQAVVAVLKMLSEYDTKRQTQYQLSARMYGNNNIVGINGLSFTKIASSSNALKDRISYNVIQAAIDTITSKIAKNKPKPMFLTSGGDYKMQRKAKKLDKFIEGVFYENDAYALGTSTFRDACVFGDGFIHVFNENGSIKYEKVFASELFMDWVEAFYGFPRQLHRCKNVDRDVLIEKFPGKKQLIADTSSASADLIGSYQNVSDQITVAESWHLPSGPGAGDGLHCIVVPNGTLFEEEWKHDRFPFAQYSWTKRLYGPWGQGAAEQIQNIQLEINKILWVIQRSMHLAGTFKVWLKNGSKVVKEHLNNDIGAIISGDEMPQYLVPPVVPPEYYAHLETLKKQAFEQIGVSQLSATSQKPAGLNSGKALREYNDIETDRFMTAGQSYERLFMDLSDLSVMVGKEIYEEDKSFSVQVPGKRFVETIPWKEVDMKEDEYVLKMYPVSSLPNDPAGRMQTVQEYVQAGWYSPRTAKKLMDFPDLEQVDNLQDAEENYLNEILEKIVDHGEMTPPEPYDDLSLAMELALEFYAEGKCNGLEEEKLEMLRVFMEQVKTLQAKATPPPPPAPAAPQPQAQPMATPTSPLLQNTLGTAFG